MKYLRWLGFGVIPMSDIFISYAREDQEVALALAAALKSMGRSVWWDRSLVAGSEFSTVIEKELTAARCVIVLWSKNAVASDFVRDEAGSANARDVLIPVRIEDVQPPLGFRQKHCADLIGWTGDAATPGFEEIVEAIEHQTSASAARAPVFGQRLLKRHSLRYRISAVAVAGSVAFAAFYAIDSTGLLERLREPRMVSLPGGEFMMGSTEPVARAALGPDHPPTWAEREQPRHRVVIDALSIDKYEVTIGEYRAFVDRFNISPAPELPDSSWDEHPMVNVSWDEARLYCQLMGKLLPTEAQWEYAASGAEDREYPWEKGPVTAKRANFCDSNCEGSSSNEDDGYVATAPVGTFETGKSRHGVYDLAGNVAEWVRDTYDPRFYETPNQTNPLKGVGSGDRVVRGGSYADESYFLRAATRNFRQWGSRHGNIGFRCVNDPDE